VPIPLNHSYVHVTQHTPSVTWISFSPHTILQPGQILTSLPRVAGPANPPGLGYRSSMWTAGVPTIRHRASNSSPVTETALDAVTRIMNVACSKNTMASGISEMLKFPMSINFDVTSQSKDAMNPALAEARRSTKSVVELKHSD